MKSFCLTLLARALLAAILSSPLVATAVPSEIRGNVSRLHTLQVGESLRFAVRTPDGSQGLILRRHVPRRTAIVSQNNIPLPEAALLSRTKLFQGRLLKRNGQIARSKLTGVAADLYQEKLNIRFYGRRSTRFYTLSLDTRAPRSAKISHLPASYPLSCAQESAHGSSQPTTVGKMALISSGRSRRVMELAVDADYEYYQDNGSSLSATNAEIESVVNVVDAIFSDQLAVSVSLVAQNVFTDSNQPYVTSSAEDLRDSLAEYRNANPFGPQFDAGHLLTGKVMYVPGFGTGIVGISYLSIYDDFSDPGTVCRYDNQYSYTVVQRVNSSTTYSGILTAHEIGHNLSLFHVESGIMNPAPEPSETDFSSVSQQTALDYIDNFGTCLAAVGPTISLTSSKIRAGKFSSSFTPGNYSGESCKLKMYASSNRYDLPEDTRRHSSATLLGSKAIASTAAKKFEGSVGSSTSRTKRKYYVMGELLCDGEIAATSEIRSISTNLPNFLSKAKAAIKKSKQAARRRQSA